MNLKNIKPANTEHGVLTKLWLIILRDKGYLNIMRQLITRYVNNTNLTSNITAKKTKASITADVTAPEMTWKKFLNLLFNVLQVKKLVITIKIVGEDDTESYHSITVPNPNETEKENKDGNPKSGK